MAAMGLSAQDVAERRRAPCPRDQGAERDHHPREVAQQLEQERDQLLDVPVLVVEPRRDEGRAEVEHGVDREHHAAATATGVRSRVPTAARPPPGRQLDPEAQQVVDHRRDRHQRPREADGLDQAAVRRPADLAPLTMLRWVNWKAKRPTVSHEQEVVGAVGRRAACRRRSSRPRSSGSGCPGARRCRAAWSCAGSASARCGTSTANSRRSHIDRRYARVESSALIGRRPSSTSLAVIVSVIGVPGHPAATGDGISAPLHLPRCHPAPPGRLGTCVRRADASSA